jgi:diaminopimelate decarboxylase
MEMELRPPGFAYRQGTLCCEQAPLARLAEAHGTPLYVYSAASLRARYEAFEDAFRRVPHTVCYSVKANSNLGILRLLGKLGCGYDIVSGGELQRVLTVDRRAGARVVYSGVGKTADELDAALRANILLFNVESESELAALARRATALKRRARVALRVNPDVAADTHPYISTGLHEHKFGVPLAEARRLYTQMKREPRLEPAGVSAHIGSQIMEPAPFCAAVTRLAELARELRSEGMDIRYLDAGGGLGIPYQMQPEAADFRNHVSAYARAIVAALRGAKLHLLLEPGRAIVGPAGVLVTRVVYAKRNDGKSFLVVDAGMNDLIRPALYAAHHEILPLSLDAAAPANRQISYDVVGPICESGDFFARGREMPEMPEGGLLAIMDAGAYGMSLASNYNTRPRPAELLVTGRTVREIRKRESFQDLVRLER